MVVHHYKARNYLRSDYHVTCTGTWMAPTHFHPLYPTSQTDFVSGPVNVTCPKCLDILIPKQEAILTRMKFHRDAARFHADEENPKG